MTSIDWPVRTHVRLQPEFESVRFADLTTGTDPLACHRFDRHAAGSGPGSPSAPAGWPT
jgi:hypothetical protein